MSSLAAVRTRVVGAIGAAAAHALQDGGTLGALFSLSLVFPPAVALLAAGLGIDGVRPRRVIAQADELVRVDDIKPNPEYFVVGFGGGALGGGVLGVGLKALATWSDVSVAIPV